MLAVAERIGRQGYLLQRDRRSVFVIEEPVLRFRPCDTEVQRDQLKRLLDIMMLPSVSFGVIPMGAGRRGRRPRESSGITDSDLVTVELLSGFLSLTRTRSVLTSPPGSTCSRSPFVARRPALLSRMRWPLLTSATGAGDAHGRRPQRWGGPLVPDFIGGDPESNASEYPAVFVDPETGDFLFRGKTVTVPALITALNEHIGKAEDESDLWLPALHQSCRRWNDSVRLVGPPR
jgi:hypothetical protein